MELKINRNAVRGPLLQCVRDIIPKRVYIKYGYAQSMETHGVGVQTLIMCIHIPMNIDGWYVQNICRCCSNGESEHLPIQLKPFLFTFQHQIQAMSLWWSHIGTIQRQFTLLHQITLFSSIFLLFFHVSHCFSLLLFLFMYKNGVDPSECTQKRITNIHMKSHTQRKRGFFLILVIKIHSLTIVHVVCKSALTI